MGDIEASLHLSMGLPLVIYPNRIIVIINSTSDQIADLMRNVLSTTLSVSVLSIAGFIFCRF